MNRKAYDTDLSETEWRLLQPWVPAAKPGGRPRSVNIREILNAIFYIQRSGCAWRLLPHDASTLEDGLSLMHGVGA